MRWMQSVVVALGKGKTEKKKDAGRNKKEKRRRNKKERRNKREGRKKNKEERARPKLIHFHLPIARPRRKLLELKTLKSSDTFRYIKVP